MAALLLLANCQCAATADEIISKEDEADYISSLKRRGPNCIENPQNYEQSLFLWYSLSESSNFEYVNRALNRIFQIKSRAFGKDSPSAAIDYLVRAFVFELQGEPRRADQFYRKAIRVRENGAISGDKILRSLYESYAEYLRKQNRHVEASAFTKKAELLPDFTDDTRLSRFQ